MIALSDDAFGLMMFGVCVVGFFVALVGLIMLLDAFDYGGGWLKGALGLVTIVVGVGGPIFTATTVDYTLASEQCAKEEHRIWVPYDAEVVYEGKTVILEDVHTCALVISED